ncbi:MAG TPA: hypothetical protein PKC89_11950 [Pyrinomonadaceae bacterium]|nr:hypothetical protein [Pyrinomonadaceae bacterium]
MGNLQLSAAETYPSGRKVKNVLDNDGNLSMVKSAAVDNGLA